VQDVAPHWMGQGLDHFINVELHGRFLRAVTSYRDGANLISVAGDIQIVRGDSHHQAC
jgi:hypothetical protein